MMAIGLRICLIANCRFPIKEPFTGGLEAMTFHLARELTRRGHHVSVFAAPGSDPELGVTELSVATCSISDQARSDVAAPADTAMAEHHAYLALMLELAHDGVQRFDLVHNHSLHHLPVAMAQTLSIPLVTTLHTPPVPWLESAMQLDHGKSSFVAVSEFTARAWRHVVNSASILNGIDAARWPAGPGGGPAVWSGRIVPEKAPHEAVDAARLACRPLVLAGPILDRGYFERRLVPRLGGSVSYAGHLSQSELAELIGAAMVAVVTPTWDEPYGLVAAEAMACGTPVAAYARGALPEIVCDGCGCLATPGDVPALAAAMRSAENLDRRAIRNHAVKRLSLMRMVDEYERCYDALLGRGAAA
jgi:glycosyltransferase involved in cell wall biosynthesis